MLPMPYHPVKYASPANLATPSKLVAKVIYKNDWVSYTYYYNNVSFHGRQVC